MKLRVTNKRREVIKDLLESYKTFVEDMDNTIKSIGKKQILIDLVKAAKKDDLWDLWYWFTDAGWYTEDKRRLRQFAIDVIENCYHEDATDSYSITNNHTIENCVFNALHKDKEEYFDGLDEHQNIDLLEYGEETSEDIEMRRMIDVIRRKYKNFDFTSKNMGFSAIKKMYDNVVKENPNILDLDSKKGFKKCIGVIPFNNNFKIMFSDGSEKIYSYQRAFDAGYLSPDLYNDLDREEYDLIQDDILKESVKSKMDELNKRYEDILKFPIHSFRNRQYADDKKSKYVTSFSATVKQSNSNLDLQIYKTSLDDLDSELSKIKDKFLNESQLNEVNLVDVMNDSKATDPKRVRLSQSLYSEYSGVDSDGTIMFHTDSQTRENHKGHDQFIFYEGFFNLLDKVDDGDHITQEDVLEIITGDLSLRCTCESFLYWAWAYKSWNNDYGLQKELRAPQRNNVNLDGGACFTGDTKVLTEFGFKDIKDIKVGDKVYTHTGNLKRVYDISKRWATNVVSTKAGTEFIKSTDDHKFLFEQHTGKPHWKRLNDSVSSDCFTSPILNLDTSVDVPLNYAFMLGLYLGDGSIRVRKDYNTHSKYPRYEGCVLSDVTIPLDSSREELYRRKFNSLGLVYTYNILPTGCGEFTFRDSDLSYFCVKFGGFTCRTGGIEHSKGLDSSVFSWSVSAKKALLQGFMFTDGTLINGNNSNNDYKARCILFNTNKKLLEDLFIIARSIGIYARFWSEDRDETNFCSSSKTIYRFSFSGQQARDFMLGDNSLCEMYDVSNREFGSTSNKFYNNYKLFPKYKTISIEPDYVYNMSVEDDESYLVGYSMIVAHNCKHLLSVLNLINQSSTLFDKIAKDLDNLFLRYKKQSKTTKKKEEEPKNESQVLTEISELHGSLDPYDLADDLLRLSTDIKSLYGKYDTDRSSTKDRDSIVKSLDSIRSFVVNKFGMMGDTTNSPSDKLVTEVEVTPQDILDSIDNVYSEIESIYNQENEVVDDSDREDHLNAIKKIKAFLVKKFKEGKNK